LLGDTYCQTCYEKTDSKGISYLQCTEKTKQALKLPTDQSGPAGTVLEEQTTTTPLGGPILEAQRANITILPGGILQEDNTSTNDDSNNTMSLDQSDLVSDTVKKPTRTVDDGGEGQDESQTNEEPSDEPVDQDKND
jgi:hypothetical protein